MTRTIMHTSGTERRFPEATVLLLIASCIMGSTNVSVASICASETHSIRSAMTKWIEEANEDKEVIFRNHWYSEELDAPLSCESQQKL